ncbi:unnamed protein product, partial [Adineta ricciae]
GIRCVTASNGFIPQVNPVCPCEKGERGEKGYPGVYCGYRYNTYARDCLSSRINVERLALSIRQLITDTKIVYQRARANPCVCQTTSSPSVVSNPYHFDYQIYARLKGDKGDAGQSCALNYKCTSVSYEGSGNRKVIDLLGPYGRLIPIVLGNTETFPVHDQNLPAKKSQCTIPLPCPALHIFALGPYARKMCSTKRPTVCSKLSEYDDLCARVSKRHQLKGFYRAFISTSTQWLANLFDGVCLDAKIMNMQEQVLFDSFEDIFEQKPLQHDILDVQGLKPQFQYWWHGSLPNGTASSDTCLDWSRQESRLSGIASRIPNTIQM